MAELLVPLVTKHCSLRLWVYVWWCCGAAKRIWNQSDTSLMAQLGGQELWIVHVLGKNEIDTHKQE